MCQHSSVKGNRAALPGPGSRLCAGMPADFLWGLPKRGFSSQAASLNFLTEGETSRLHPPRSRAHFGACIASYHASIFCVASDTLTSFRPRILGTSLVLFYTFFSSRARIAVAFGTALSLPPAPMSTLSKYKPSTRMSSGAAGSTLGSTNVQSFSG